MLARGNRADENHSGRETRMAYEVPDLPYDYNALEPHIDEQTMRIHHDKHHQAYVDKANAALEGTEWADKPVHEVLANLSSLPAIFNVIDWSAVAERYTAARSARATA